MKRKNKGILLCFLASLLFFTSFFLPPLPQPTSYHDFADKEKLLFIPNACDTLSNIAIFLVGLFGIFFLHQVKLQNTSRKEKILWYVFFGATAITGVFSFYYHWQPNHFRLAIDRLGLAFLAPTLLAIMVMERIEKKVGWIAAPYLIIFSLLSVLYWGIFDDLRFYLLIQGGSVFFIFMILALFESHLPGKSYLFLAFIFYGLSKLSEFADKTIYEMLHQTLSGHTLKHLFSALGALALMGYLNQRK